MKPNKSHLISAFVLSVIPAISFAANTEITLTNNAFIDIDRATKKVTESEAFDIKPVAKTATTAGFLKNTFAFALSANVVMGVKDNGVVFGVVAGSPGGRNVFTGSTEGGSVATCGNPTVSTDTTTTPATLVVDATLDMTKSGGCARTASGS